MTENKEMLYTALDNLKEDIGKSCQSSSTVQLDWRTNANETTMYATMVDYIASFSLTKTQKKIITYSLIYPIFYLAAVSKKFGGSRESIAVAGKNLLEKRFIIYATEDENSKGKSLYGYKSTIPRNKISKLVFVKINPVYRPIFSRMKDAYLQEFERNRGR